jgi:hypothetical protein
MKYASAVVVLSYLFSACTNYNNDDPSPDGIPLEKPGLRYYTEEVYVDNFDLTGEINLAKHYWDAENALNVWVCPFINTETSDVPFVAGFTHKI